MSWLYGIQCGPFIKIGITHDMQGRLREMRLYNPHPLKLVIQRQLCDDARAVEIRAHKALANYAKGREWFEVDVAVARAAVSNAIRVRKEELRAWRIEYQRRAQELEAKAAARGIVVESDATKLRKIRYANKKKMLERLAGGEALPW